MTIANTPNREQWLANAATQLATLFAGEGYKVPANIRYTCGFPSRSALARKGRRIGECWDTTASAGNVFEIFISPVLADPLEVAGVLAHEIVHAVVGLQAKHGPAFRKCALGVGLAGKMKATVPGPKFIAWFESEAAELGPYPHQELRASSAPPKQTTRLVKCACPECADAGEPYIVRLSAKTLAIGAPICPVHECSLIEG